MSTTLNQPENRRQIGTQGEELALQYLLKKGYVLKQKNYRVPRGEIDLIVEDPQGVLIFVEVKSAQADQFGPPASRVTRAKIKIIQKVAQRYVAENHYEKRAMRFDVISIDLSLAQSIERTKTSQTANPNKIEHLENAFLPDGNGYYAGYLG